MQALYYDNALFLFAIHAPALIQFLVGTLLFSHGYTRKPHFAARMATGITIALLAFAAVLVPISRLPMQTLIGSVRESILIYAFLLAENYILLRNTFEESRRCILTGLMTGYAYQHFGSQVCLCVYVLFSQNFDNWILGGLVFRFVEIWIFAAIAAGIYFLFARQANYTDKNGIQDKNVWLLSLCTIGLLLLLSSFRDYYQDESLPLTLITRIFSMFCSVLLLLLRSGFFEQSHLQAEIQTIQQLHRREIAQYQQNKEMIDLINTKCHDIRHRLAQYRIHPDAITCEELAQLEKGISIYDCTIKTGNETLDVILTERSLLCQKMGITFSCIVDGSSLGALSPGDIYSLFGNAVDNAIEAVVQLPQEADRIISLNVRQRMGMLSILVENPYAGKVDFADGLPRTTKQDTQEHGYGIRSIQMIVRKYGGEMTVTADELFHLSILLPISNHAEVS